MSHVIKAVLSNTQHPECGQITNPFPIPTARYDQTIEMLQAAELGFSINRDCKVDESDSVYTVLELPCIKDFINLTCRCQQATVITDSSNLEQVGRDHYMNLHGGCAQTEELEYLDGVETAYLLISDNEGTIPPFGVVYDNGMVLEQCYNGYQFPAYLYESYPIAVEITPKCGLREGQNPEYLYLPAAENLDQFDFIPGIQTSEEYGRYMIQQSGHFEYDENLKGFYNYRLYGEQHIQKEDGQFNECGYVAYHGTMALEELIREYLDHPENADDFSAMIEIDLEQNTIRVDEDMSEEREYHEFPVDVLLEQAKQFRSSFTKPGPNMIPQKIIYKATKGFEAKPPEQSMTGGMSFG